MSEWWQLSFLGKLSLEPKWKGLLLFELHFLLEVKPPEKKKLSAKIKEKEINEKKKQDELKKVRTILLVVYLILILIYFVYFKMSITFVFDTWWFLNSE